MKSKNLCKKKRAQSGSIPGRLCSWTWSGNLHKHENLTTGQPFAKKAKEKPYEKRTLLFLGEIPKGNL